MGPRI